MSSAKTFARMISFGLILCSALPASGYEGAGHFYTISVLTRLVEPKLSVDDARTVAFCAQLPDQSTDLSATEVYYRSIKKSLGAWQQWAREDKIASDEVRRMVTVQQLLHGLTGGRATAVQGVAVNSLRSLRQQVPSSSDANRSAAWCAVGFGLHLYGDAFAHQRMGARGSGSDPDQMYSTGRGHAAHFHYPDWPFCGEFSSLRRALAYENCNVVERGRFGRWADYWIRAALYLGPTGNGGAIDQKVHSDIIDKVFKLSGKASDVNDWAEWDMGNTLMQAGADGQLGAFLASQKSSQPCQDVLDLALRTARLPNIGSFSCRSAWESFFKVVRSEFQNNKDARERLRVDLDANYMTNPLLK